MRFWAYTGDHFERFATERQARNAAHSALDQCREEAVEYGWPDEAESICWGTVTECVVETSREELDGDPVFDARVDFGLVSAVELEQRLEAQVAIAVQR